MATILASAARCASLVVLFTNDVHGRLAPRNLVGDKLSGGAPALLEIVEAERARLGEDQDLVLLDSGDFLFGSFRASRYRGLPAIRMLNEIGYTAVGLGNHEFDLGRGTLRLRAHEARFPFLCANVYRAGSRLPLEGVRPSRLMELPRTGLRLGLVGVTLGRAVPTGPGSRNPGLTFGDAGAALRHERERLAGQGAQLVIVLSHQGIDADLEMLEGSGPAPEVLIGGHFPSGQVDQRRGRTLLLQARPEGFEVGRVEIPLEDGRPVLERARVGWLPWVQRPVGENRLTAILREFPEPRDQLATSARRWSLGETAGWVLDSMLESARAGGQEVAVAAINRGAIRASMPMGDITPRTLHRIAPFDNHLVRIELSGRSLRDLLVEAAGSAGNAALLWRGPPLATLARRARVSLVLNDYLAGGGDGHHSLTTLHGRQVLVETVREAMHDAIRRQGPQLTPPGALPEDQFRLSPEPLEEPDEDTREDAG